MRYAKVGKPPGSQGVTPFRIAICGVILLVLAAIFYPVFQPAKIGKPSTALRNLHWLAHGLELYCADHDERFPTAEVWMDALWPYQSNTQYFVNQDAAKVKEGPAYEDRLSGVYGFSFVDSMSQRAKSELPEPAPQAVIFSSTDLRWNAHGKCEGFVPFRGGKNILVVTGLCRVRLRDVTAQNLGPDGKIKEP